MTKWEHILLIPFYVFVAFMLGIGLYLIGSMLLFRSWADTLSVVAAFYVVFLVIYFGAKNK